MTFWSCLSLTIVLNPTLKIEILPTRHWEYLQRISLTSPQESAKLRALRALCLSCSCVLRVPVSHVSHAFRAFHVPHMPRALRAFMLSCFTWCFVLYMPSSLTWFMPCMQSCLNGSCRTCSRALRASRASCFPFLRQ